MKILLNNRPEIFEAETMTIEELIKFKNFTFKMLVTKKNGKLIRKDERKKISIKDGDEIHVIHLISGG